MLSKLTEVAPRTDAETDSLVIGILADAIATGDKSEYALDLVDRNMRHLQLRAKPSAAIKSAIASAKAYLA